MTGTTEPIQHTADVVCIRGAEVLLIERRWDPYPGQLAVPGGYVEPGETARVAAARELLEETGVTVDVASLVKIGVYGMPGRDPRGRVVSTAYLAVVEEGTQAEADDDAAAVQWVPLAEVGYLAFDHNEIVRDGEQLMKRIQGVR